VGFAANGYDAARRRLTNEALWFVRNYLSAKPRRTLIGKRDVNKQAATGEDDAGTMLPLAYVSEKDGNSDFILSNKMVMGGCPPAKG
jgi:hypothetical protein